MEHIVLLDLNLSQLLWLLLSFRRKSALLLSRPKIIITFFWGLVTNLWLQTTRKHNHLRIKCQMRMALTSDGSGTNLIPRKLPPDSEVEVSVFFSVDCWSISRSSCCLLDFIILFGFSLVTFFFLLLSVWVWKEEEAAGEERMLAALALSSARTLNFFWLRRVWVWGLWVFLFFFNGGCPCWTARWSSQPLLLLLFESVLLPVSLATLGHW